ncbi:MAG TPA: hypothetical protein VM327_02850 [Candidatus Thermoplasmatota archaeon]|nr:hypothetical protein [Candidatus Thermoplasmatota archaeon]
MTRRRDNKSDPNIETGTYGLFSTCERGMRNGLVKNNRRYLLFVTRRGTARYLTGYYDIGWYADGREVIAYKGQPDRALAGREWRFIDPPIPLAAAAAAVGDLTLARRFRLNKIISDPQALALIGLLRRRKERTSLFVNEVRRLETVNNRFWGFRYVSWQRKDGFSWDHAAGYLKSNASTPSLLPAGFRASGGTVWTCLDCHNEVESLSPLKMCQKCGSIGRQAVRT